MDYIGEHLLPGQLGHFFITLSLVASIVASFAYFKATRHVDTVAGDYYWKKLARIAFLIEVVSVFSIFIILFYIIYNHLFEYKYAWQHSSRSLEFKYLLSCFWEGQEGSTLLWSIWHCVLGLVLIKTGKTWEAPVMSVVSFVQFCLATMLTGLYIFEWKMGSNPFTLLRDSGVLDNAVGMHMNADITQPLRPDYLNFIKDGNDLNPLLQNYWMVIHPPVLFLGFASTLIPFAFAIAALWTRRYTDWIKQVLPWSLFSLAVLGVGIMMGAAWAYESLTFGGYWAWDPVENASLVPWLILVAGVHTLLIYKHSGHSLKSTFLFMILTFVFILYSTFLTKSGVLGESSVHAFTDSGMNVQLVSFLAIFFIPSIILLINRSKEIPAIRKEEATSSREFWMFIGSLVFFLTAIVISAKTSLPVFNKIFGTKIAAPEDEEFAYNQIQIHVAIIIGILTAIVQYLRYKSTTGTAFWKKIWIPTIISILAATAILYFGDINYQTHGAGYLGAIWLAIIAAVYAIIANAAYIWVGVNGKLKLSGGSISHLGFGLVLLGILLSSSKKEILSRNSSGIAIDFGKESKEKAGENLTLVKGFPMKMGKFDVTYEKDSAHPKKQQWYYFIHFKSRTDKEEFTLKPNAFVNYKGNEGLMANPDSRHYLDHDVFTYISALPNPEKNKDTATFKPNPVRTGDSIFYSKGYLIVEKVATRDSLPFDGFRPGDKATVATIGVHSLTRGNYTAEALLIDQGGKQFAVPDTIMPESLILQLNSVTGDSLNIGVKESNTILEYVTLKAYKFPYINVLWIGIIITAIGILMSMVRRIQLNRQLKKA
ncbi:cytochrome c biogenesis protein CcsA [Terrimonas sp. NA20]|uniref:Cytochrome c biogenesis protein CcsA n=1 Tax=Terrimonas ginsenosidimutans TaxID=2908004 RepID=A0ABS9KZR1_9BACT|nr:cytochrome c biogenesis protein CcsA [Terrimonas ginsenosidimutans]MCG2617830.1 cytochrome c biogenesis protein CcsA [Terrimonas ginsenosidimutans]